jgi:hypothetical protein
LVTEKLPRTIACQPWHNLSWKTADLEKRIRFAKEIHWQTRQPVSLSIAEHRSLYRRRSSYFWRYPVRRGRAGIGTFCVVYPYSWNMCNPNRPTLHWRSSLAAEGRSHAIHRYHPLYEILYRVGFFNIIGSSFQIKLIVIGH